MSGQTTFKLDSAKRDKEELVRLLQKKNGGTNYSAKRFCCPFHEDVSPSACLRQAGSGIWYFYCFGCPEKVADDLIALKVRVEGISIAEALRAYADNKQEKTNSERYNTKIFETGENTMNQEFGTYEAAVKSLISAALVIEEENKYYLKREFEFSTVRLRDKSGKKTFRPVSQTKEGLWVIKNLEGKLPLFNRNTINKCSKVLVVEGEKCVRAVHELGIDDLAATTSPGGSGAAGKADWSILKGKIVIIWRDNDKPGINYQNQVIEELKDIAAEIRLVSVEDLGLNEKEDAADYLQNLAQAQPSERIRLLKLVLDDAEPVPGKIESVPENGENKSDKLALELQYDEIKSGAYKTLRFPQFPALSRLTKAGLPGTVTCICGNPNAGKSFFLLENAWRWSEEGLKVRYLMLEDEEEIHQARVLAQMAGVSNLTDTDYISAHHEQASSLLKANLVRLKAFTKSLTCSESKTEIRPQMTLPQVSDWVIKQAEAGADVIIVDPITAAVASNTPWIDDQLFLFQVKGVLKKNGARLIISTHPRTGKNGQAGLSGLVGGAGYPRFSHSVIWIDAADEEAESMVMREDRSVESLHHKQTFLILKARHGKGRGQKIAASLDKNSLCYQELGLIFKGNGRKLDWLFQSFAKPSETFIGGEVLAGKDSESTAVVEVRTVSEAAGASETVLTCATAETTLAFEPDLAAETETSNVDLLSPVSTDRESTADPEISKESVPEACRKSLTPLSDERPNYFLMSFDSSEESSLP